MPRKTIHIYLDTVGNQVLSTATALERGDTPQTSINENVLFCVHLLGRSSSNAPEYRTDIPVSATFSANFKDDFNSATRVYTKSNNDVFNLEADWVDVDPTAGKICFRMSFDTQQMETALGTDESMTGRLEINIYDAGYSTVYYTFWCTHIVVNAQDRRTFTDLTVSTDFSTTAGSTTSIVMVTDQTANIEVGAVVKITDDDDNVYYGTVASITDSLLSITFHNGETLPVGTGDIAGVAYEIMPTPIPRTYYNTDEVDALLAGYVSAESLTDITISDASKGLVFTYDGHTYRLNVADDDGIKVPQLAQVT